MFRERHTNFNEDTRVLYEDAKKYALLYGGRYTENDLVQRFIREFQSSGIELINAVKTAYFPKLEIDEPHTLAKLFGIWFRQGALTRFRAQASEAVQQLGPQFRAITPRKEIVHVKAAPPKIQGGLRVSMIFTGQDPNGTQLTSSGVAMEPAVIELQQLPARSRLTIINPYTGELEESNEIIIPVAAGPFVRVEGKYRYAEEAAAYLPGKNALLDITRLEAV